MTRKGLYRIGITGICGVGLVLAGPQLAGGSTTHRAPAAIPALSGKVTHVPFSASYKGAATLVVVSNGTSGSASIHNAHGTGSAHVIGAGSFKQVGKANAPSFGQQGSDYCSKFTGEALLRGAKGTITLKVIGASEVCSNTDSGVATAQVEKGKAEVIHATGAATGVTGIVGFTGKLVTNSTETSGTFVLTLKGNLAKK